MRTWLRLLPTVALWAACSDNSVPLEAPGGGGSTGGGSGDGGRLDARRPSTPVPDAARTGDAATDFAVHIVDPGKDSVVSEGDTVRVRVVRGGAAPSVQTVKISVTGGLTKIISRESGSEDTYSGAYSLGEAPSGPSTLTATVTAVGGMDRVDTLPVKVNNGPIFRFILPQPSQSIGATLDIAVEATPPFDGEGVDPTSLVANIADQMDVPLVPNAEMTRYDAAVDLTRGFDPPLLGDTQITVRGATAGTAAPVRIGHRSERFVVDRVGPTITNVKPAPGELVGSGIYRLQADVSDPAGVDPTQVYVRLPGLPGGMDRFQLMPIGGDTFARDLDTRLYGQPHPEAIVYPVFPSILVSAADAVGNPSSVGFEFALDNEPPIIEFDIPKARSVRKENNKLFCSHEIDELGEDNIRDKKKVRQVFDARVFAYDIGNFPCGTEVAPIAGISTSGVSIYAVSVPSGDVELVEDSDNDGVCDRITFALDPAHAEVMEPAGLQKARRWELNQIPVQGSPDQTADSTLPAASGGFCESDVAPAPAPEPCGGVGTSSAQAILPKAAGNNALSFVWGIPPLDACGARSIDALAAGLQTNTWACVVGAASDNVGNTSVSAPIRVCISHDFTGACSSPPPSCRKSNCRARRFTKPSVYYAGPGVLRGSLTMTPDFCTDHGNESTCDLMPHCL